ncbi:MAG TPA: 6-bladed beta-propeller, partial [Gemmatimonadaceae bacterium]|nr:6-bladed beta-propeller [Gemmatimonadaceae bacterium]
MNRHAALLSASVGAVLALDLKGQSTPRVERTRAGDTSIVRTLSGSVWRDTMTLVSDAAIGKPDGPDAYVFGYVRAIDVDSAGRVYVLDLQAHEVRVFSKSGEHLRSFGRRGQGPGEFEVPSALHVLPDGRVMVRDRNMRMSLFAQNGTYLSGWLLNTGFGAGESFFVTADGRVLNPTFMDRLVWYDAAG